MGTPIINDGVEGRGEFSVTVQGNLDRLGQVLASQDGNWTLSVDDIGRAVFNVRGLEVTSSPYLNLSPEDKGQPDQLITVGEDFVVTAVRQTNGSLRIYLNGVLHNTACDANQVNDHLDYASVIVGNEASAGHIDRFILENKARDFETAVELELELNPQPYDKDLRDVIIDVDSSSYDEKEDAQDLYAVDGNLATYWASSPAQLNTETPQYLQLNFADSQLVDKVTYFARQTANAVGNVKLAYLEYSNDGVSWERLPLLNGNEDDTITLDPTVLTGQEIVFQPTSMLALRFYAPESAHWNEEKQNTVIAVAELVPSVVVMPEVSEKLDITYLRNTLTAAEGLDGSIYTEESFAPVAKMLVQKDRLLALDTQESIDQARKDLVDLILGLEMIEPEVETPEEVQHVGHIVEVDKDGNVIKELYDFFDPSEDSIYHVLSTHLGYLKEDGYVVYDYERVVDEETGAATWVYKVVKVDSETPETPQKPDTDKPGEGEKPEEEKPEEEKPEDVQPEAEKPAEEDPAADEDSEKAAVLPETGEADNLGLLSVSAVSVLTGIGLVARRRE